MFHETLPVEIYEIIAAVLGATISGILLLLTHHKKVNQEIEKHRKIDNFEKRKKAYRKILEMLSKLLDHSHLLGKPVNWKITRYAYNEILLVGSKEVVEKTNELMLSIGESDSSVTDAKVKNLWNAIRNDLHGEELSPEQMHMIRPSTETLAALSLYHNYSNQLKSAGINSLEKARDMDLSAIHAATQIDTNELLDIKEMAKNELMYDDELNKFLDEE